jgi:alkylation response protein AidB-like acyl-CoA dehydrogenase
MPYLEKRWPPAQFSEGDWVPEIDPSRWARRHEGLPLATWVKQGFTDSDADALAESNDWLKYLRTLGADIGSVQRDGYFYANFLEQLKQAAPVSVGDSEADQAADDVVERMKTMGFTSANLPEQSGGPPERKSLRPWKDVMKWLLRQLRKVGQFLANSIQAFGALVGNLAVGAANKISVGFSAGFPLGVVGFEIELAYLTDGTTRDILKQFIDAIMDEAEKLFEE